MSEKNRDLKSSYDQSEFLKLEVTDWLKKEARL